jgi:two-component system, NtrC family, response regulator AtoC
MRYSIEMTRQVPDSPGLLGNSRTASAGPNEVFPEPRFDLFVSGASTLITVSLNPGKLYSIGRDATCDIVVDDPSVSRRHAELDIVQLPTITDLGSRNGTFVGGVRIRSEVPTSVVVGGVVTVGRATLLLQVPRLKDRTALRTSAPPAMPSPPSRDTVVADPVMRNLYAMLDLVAPAPISVLILGETGVGKEIFAAEVHRRSGRAASRFLTLNCAAMPESMLEAELFGYERGAFTGAVQSKPGLFESADGGTVLLDEVGDMALATQAKLLRVLESGEVLRLGGLTPRQVDIRFIAATNRDLEQAIREGAFRSDLFFRLNGMTFTLPPLRARRFDIEPLALAFIARVALRMKRSAPALSAEVLEQLKRAPWPGNVRELRNVIERAVVLCQGTELQRIHLPESPSFKANSLGFEPDDPCEMNDSVTLPGKRLDLAALTATASAESRAPSRAPVAGDGSLMGAVRVLERERIAAALQACAGNQSRAAKMLGIARATLLARMDEFGLARPRKRPASE